MVYRAISILSLIENQLNYPFILMLFSSKVNYLIISIKQSLTLAQKENQTSG